LHNVFAAVGSTTRAARRSVAEALSNFTSTLRTNCSVIDANELPGVGRTHLMDDMDAWGYTFRLGSARAWFKGDAGDAFAFLIEHELINPAHCLLARFYDQATAENAL
jgi:hypothetical protein